MNNVLCWRRGESECVECAERERIVFLAVVGNKQKAREFLRKKTLISMDL